MRSKQSTRIHIFFAVICWISLSVRLVDGCWGRLCQRRSDIFNPFTVLVAPDVKQNICRFRLLKSMIKKIYNLQNTILYLHKQTPRLLQRHCYRQNNANNHHPCSSRRQYLRTNELKEIITSISKLNDFKFWLTVATAKPSIVITDPDQVINGIRWIWINYIRGHI